MMAGSHVIAAIDGSDRAMASVQFACDNLLTSPCSRLEVTTISATHDSPNGIFANGYPGIDKYASEEHSIAERNAERTEQATNILLRAAEDCAKLRIPPGHVTYHSLPAVGGASGVAESLVQHTRLTEHVLLVLSSRGAGATDEVMSSPGLGSVSKYCIRNVPYATIIVPCTPVAEVGEGEGPEGDTAMKVDSPTRVCICVDGSEITAAVLAFAARHFPSSPGVELHLVCVALARQLRFEEAEYEAFEVDKLDTAATSSAERACAKSLEFLQGNGVVADQVRRSVLPHSGKADPVDVPDAIVAYCRDQAITMCVMGSHGNSTTLAQAPQRLVGLGSVSDAVVSRMPCSVCVVRPQQWLPVQQQQQPQVTGVSAEVAA